MADAFTKEIGLVRTTKHYLASIEGLPSAHVHDIIVNEKGDRALVTALSHDAVEVMLLDSMDVRPGEQFELQPQENQLSFGPFLMGRTVNALGDPIDGKGALPPANATLALELEAGDLARRAPITKLLETGYAMLDTVLPIGKGQRQLLMGPIQSGTDVFCREVIRNQDPETTVCIYASIGKPATAVRRLTESLFAGEAAENTVVLASTADDGAPQNTLAPSVALLMAEHYAREGKDVLVILDDLYTHAKYLREIALLQGRLPGRESYPGDVFYQQAHLIERAGSFVDGGSITLLPLLQTDIESTTDLIMTNIMGTTDGHLQFSSALHAQGVFPPIHEDESVTRVGKHAHTMVQKQLSTTIVSALAEAKEQERYSQFGSDVSESTQSVIDMGRIFRFLLDQDEELHVSVEVQAVLLTLVLTSFTSGKDVSFFRKNIASISEIAHSDELATVRDAVHTEQDFNTFLAEMEKQVNKFQKACQQ